MVDKRLYDILPFYNEGLDFYKTRDFASAFKCFTKCYEIMPEDYPTKIYIERCREYIKNPPKKDWDGVFTINRK